MIFANIEGLQTFGKLLREDKIGMAYIANINDTFVTFQRNKDRNLDMFITGRSSDPIQDTVVISMIQEIMARLADCKVGNLWWQSMNVHIDVERAEKACQALADKDAAPNPYDGEVAPHAMIDIPMNRWIREIDTFTKLQHRGSYTDFFFSNVVVPLHQSGVSLKNGQYNQALTQLDSCAASDWRKACYNWIISESMRTP